MPPVLLKATQFHRYLAHSVGLYTLQSRRDYLKCMLVFKSLHGLAPAYLIDEFSHSRDFHSYNTCHRDLLRLPLARTTKYQGSFRFSGAKIWNTLPLDLRSEHDINKVLFGLKRHFTSKPNWASVSFVILSCTIFYLYLSGVLFFLFHQGPIQTSLAELGTPEYRLKKNTWEKRSIDRPNTWLDTTIGSVCSFMFWNKKIKKTVIFQLVISFNWF